jgi:hypothetical protein
MVSLENEGAEEAKTNKTMPPTANHTTACFDIFDNGVDATIIPPTRIVSALFFDNPI